MNLFGKYINYLANKVDICLQTEVGNLLPWGESKKYLDLGCDAGSKTISRAKSIGTRYIYGVEKVKDRAQLAEKVGIKVSSVSLNGKLPYKDSFFDCITATEVIEHLTDIDNFLFEIYRVLKKGGRVIITTENLAGYHNIFALLLGNQPFTGPYLSKKFSVIKRPIGKYWNEKVYSNMDPHINVMTIKSLERLLGFNGFKIIKVKGVGFYPLPYFLSRLACIIDKYHSSYGLVCAEK